MVEITFCVLSLSLAAILAEFKTIFLISPPEKMPEYFLAIMSKFMFFERACFFGKCI